MPSAQDCADRLREQAYKTLLPQIKDLEEELQNVRSSLSNGIHQLGQKLDVLRHTELPTTELILGEILGEVIRQKELETNALALFAGGLRQKETQEEILAFLLDEAQKYSPRIALFSVRGDQCIGWSSRGYSESAAKTINSCAFLASECPQFKEALEAENPVTTQDLPDNEPLVSLKEETKGPWHIFALRVLQRPVALLLAGEANDISCNPDAFSILMDLTALRLENTALKILYELGAVKLEPVPQPIPVTEERSAEAIEQVFESQQPTVEEQVQEAISQTPDFAQEPVLAPEPEPIPEPVLAPEPEPIPEPVLAPEPEPIPEPVLAPEPEPIPEPVLAPEPEPIAEPEPVAEVVSAAPAAEAAAPPVSEVVETAAPAPPPEAPKVTPKEAEPIPEEEKLHSDAKRFARLLVSEIKLYNENPVAEGRANRDLYLRLKRDIDRSREMYEKRVSPTVSKKIDYFHDEIVRILGDNDPSTLGSDYPGPRVDS